MSSKTRSIAELYSLFWSKVSSSAFKAELESLTGEFSYEFTAREARLAC